MLTDVPDIGYVHSCPKKERGNSQRESPEKSGDFKKITNTKGKENGMGDKWERRQDEKGRATGAARNAAGGLQRLVRGKNRGRGDVADYSALDAKLLKRAIDAVTGAGCAIRFGYTRDKGAYAVGILGDGEPYTEYLRPAEDADYFFNALSEDFESVAAPVPDAPPAETVSKKS